MQALFRVFWDIVVFRRGPRDVPPSLALLATLAVLYAATSVVQARVMFAPVLALTCAIADLGLTCAVFAVALMVRGRRHRLVQTLSAVLGSGALLSLPLIALMSARSGVADADPRAFLLSVALVPFEIWYLFVMGHIARLALEVTLFTGMAIAMTYAVLSYVLVEQLPAAVN
jgi:hypothetical protein